MGTISAGGLIWGAWSIVGGVKSCAGGGWPAVGPPPKRFSITVGV